MVKIRKILLAIPNAFIWCANIMRYMSYNPPRDVGPKIGGYDSNDDFKYLK